MKASELRRTHTELVAGDYEDIMPEDDQIFAYTRDDGNKKATIIINFTNENVDYDPDCVEEAKCILSTEQGEEKGRLRPYEAVIYEE
ncbi:MAG: DUF3459 domain-containing protein [Lachnospiraceae bacterium]|nr:DUF3459 domain-containing protein [Lachnospiraceae bacterium]